MFFLLIIIKNTNEEVLRKWTITLFNSYFWQNNYNRLKLFEKRMKAFIQTHQSFVKPIEANYTQPLWIFHYLKFIPQVRSCFPWIDETKCVHGVGYHRSIIFDENQQVQVGVTYILLSEKIFTWTSLFGSNLER